MHYLLDLLNDVLRGGSMHIHLSHGVMVYEGRYVSLHRTISSVTIPLLVSIQLVTIPSA